MQCLAPPLDNRNHIIASGSDKVEKVRISLELAHSEKMATDLKTENDCFVSLLSDFEINIVEQYLIARILSITYVAHKNDCFFISKICPNVILPFRALHMCVKMLSVRRTTLLT